MDSCSTIYPQNIPSNVLKMIGVLESSKFLLATKSKSPLSTLVSESAIGLQLQLQAIMTNYGLLQWFLITN